MAGAAGIIAVQAQSASSVAGLTEVDKNAPLLLEADELIYDNDQRTVAAVGNVRIDYGGTRVVADRVVYKQRDERLLAIGNVEIVQPDGTTVNADEIDITQDYRDGFVNSLRIVTPDRTFFAAESAERANGNVTTFNNGVYTACEPCEDNPNKAPIWQIKSRRIIWNGEEKTVRFEDARFEFFGMPIAYAPVFTTADPTVKRKTGFLIPGFHQDENLGFGVSVPYFIALAPNYDLTLTGTGYTNQGFLGEAEFRHRLENGTYTLKMAGIQQQDPDTFGEEKRYVPIDEQSVNRGMIGSTGRFKINPRWTFGWNVLAQTDKNFSRTYSIEGFNDLVQKNEVYLTGINDRNLFDLSFMKFDIQEDRPNSNAAARDDEQPTVLPSLDYQRISSEPVAGGELAFDFNVRSVSREQDDTQFSATTALPYRDRFATRGVADQNSRVTTEAEWKRTLVTPGGLTVTPILAAQGDAIFINSETSGAVSDSLRDDGVSFDGDADYYRSMVTAGMEVRWPFLLTAPGSRHVLEPVAQVFVRPNEMYAGEVPNEDAQSFVFDATNLLERDKFSGYDRVEGGHRTNLALRYTGSYDNGWSVYGLAGQSYHLGGENPFTNADLVNVGAESGLETDVSDYVAMIGTDYRNKVSAALRGRFDQQSFEVRRTEAELAFSQRRLRLVGGYAYTAPLPEYGYPDEQHELAGSASLQFHDYWRVFGSATYDIVDSDLTKRAVGLAYDDECFGVQFTYKQTVSTSDAVSTSYGFKLSFRTLGDIGSSSDDIGLQ